MIMTLQEIKPLLYAAQGGIDRIYCHWTGAPYRMTEFLAYHIIIDTLGYYHVMHQDFRRVLAHTWRRNSRAIGIAMACCKDACCWQDTPDGVTFGSEPPTPEQIESMALFCAMATDILPISTKGIYTHAEIATIDGYGIHSSDADLRWDLLYLPNYQDNETPVPGGDLIRGKCEYYRTHRPQ